MASDKTNLGALVDLGQSVWIDNLTRKMVEQGGLQRLINEDSVSGVTSNPTIFQKAIAEGDAYDKQLQELSAETDPREVFIQLAARDIRGACDQLLAVWDNGGGKDGYVSMEVDPTFSHATERTFEQAKRFVSLIDRPNLLVKIPATKAGLPAIEDSIASGISINVTLIFSLERYKEVVEAYLRGLERLTEKDGDLSKVASVASFFISRVDVETDRRLDEIGQPSLKGKLAIANARLAYQHYLEVFSSPRFKALEEQGATPQRCLWASTGAKNPDYRDTLYVEELIGPSTVNTMPDETIEAFQDHGVVAETLTKDVSQAQALFTELKEAGLDYDDLVNKLEEEGVSKFVASFDELIAGIDKKRQQLK